MKIDKVWYKKTGLVNPLIAFYFFLALINIIAEYHQDYFFIRYTKPLIILFLVIIYLVTARNKNKFYFLSLLLTIISNLFLTYQSDSFAILASVFLFLSQLAIIIVIMQKIKFPGETLLALGAFPFGIISILVALLVYDKLGLAFYLFLLQALLIVLVGGLALANFLTKYNKANAQLFYGVGVLSASQFLLVMANSFTNIKLLFPLTTMSLVIGHYLVYKFVVGQEKHRRKYKIVN